MIILMQRDTAAVVVVSGHKKKKVKNMNIFNEGDLVVRKHVPDSEYGIVVEEIELDVWARAKDAMEIADFRNMHDKAVKVIWFWCTDKFSTYQKGKGGGRLHDAWELASRLVRAEDSND